MTPLRLCGCVCVCVYYACTRLTESVCFVTATAACVRFQEPAKPDHDTAAAAVR